MTGSAVATGAADEGAAEGAEGGGIFHAVRAEFASASSVSWPESTSERRPAAATGLLMEAAWKSVSGVAGAESPARARP